MPKGSVWPDHSKEDGVEIPQQLSQGRWFYALVEAEIDAHSQDLLDLGQSECRRNLVGGDAKRVETAGDIARLEHDRLVAQLAKLVRTAQAGRAGADQRDAFAGRIARPEELDSVGRRCVGRMTLQPATLNRRLEMRVSHAGTFAEHFHRTGAGTAPAEDVGAEDRAGCPDVVLIRDLSDEQGHVDMCGTARMQGASE